MSFTTAQKTISVGMVLCIAVVLVVSTTLLQRGNYDPSVKQPIPSPFDELSYLYSVRETDAVSGIGASFYSNAEKLSESDGVKWGTVRYKPLSDGTGFYQLKNAEKANAVPCGTETLEKSSGFIGSNSTCITHNNRNYLAVDWPDYADQSLVIYQQCEKFKFYPRDDVNLPGRNECQKLLLKVNDSIVDVASERYVSKQGEGKFLVGANKFESVRIADGKLTYLKREPSTNQDVFIVYDLDTGQRTEFKNYRGRSIASAQLVNGSPAFLVWNADLSKDFFYLDQAVSNIEDFVYYKGHFYFIKRDPARKGLSEGISLLKDDVSLGHLDGFYSNGSLGAYPTCNLDTLVCIYGGNDFAAKSSEFDGEPVYINSMIFHDRVFDRVENAYVFSRSGQTFIVYHSLNKIYGRNLDTGEVVTLFELDSQSIVDDLRVFEG